MPTFRITLDLPVPRDRYTRAWPENTARLLVFEYDPGRSGEPNRTAFAEWLATLPEPGEDLYAHPLSCLLPDHKVRLRVLERGINDAAERLAEHYWLFRCKAPQVLKYLMEEAFFESVVFFCAADSGCAREVVRDGSVNATLQDNRYETGFLLLTGPSGGYVFYSHAHENLEVLGHTRFVVGRCLMKRLVPYFDPRKVPPGVLGSPERAT